MATAVAPILYRASQINYLDTPVELDEIVQQTTAQTIFAPGTSDHRATLGDLTDTARDLPTEEALSLEIEKLCNATLAIDEAFCDIGRKLSDATNEQNGRIDVHDTCCALEAQWNEHHLMYQILLWRSRDFAGEAQATVDAFREEVLPLLRDPDMTRAEKQDIMREQIKVLQDTSQPSKKLCQEFLDFGRTLDKYIADLSRIIEGFGIAEKSQRVAGLEDRLRSARAAMEAISREMKELGWKFAGEVAIAGITLLLAFVVPTLWSTLAKHATLGAECMNVGNSGLRLLDVRKRSDLAIKKYETIQAEYDLEKAGLCQMVKLESTLHDATPLVQDVTMKLGIFASVWAAITADIRKLKNSLDRAEDLSSKLFVRRVERLEKMYGYLSQALRHYQVTVRLD